MLNNTRLATTNRVVLLSDLVLSRHPCPLEVVRSEEHLVQLFPNLRVLDGAGHCMWQA